MFLLRAGAYLIAAIVAIALVVGVLVVPWVIVDRDDL